MCKHIFLENHTTNSAGHDLASYVCADCGHYATREDELQISEEHNAELEKLRNEIANGVYDYLLEEDTDPLPF